MLGEVANAHIREHDFYRAFCKLQPNQYHSWESRLFADLPSLDLGGFQNHDFRPQHISCMGAWKWPPVRLMHSFDVNVRCDAPTYSDLTRPPIPILSARGFRGIRPPL